MSAGRDRERSKAASDTILVRQMAIELQQLKSQQVSTTAQLSSTLRNILAQEGGTPGDQTGMSPADRAALNQVVEGQKQLTTRIEALEGALLNEPVKALAVPLLKKDVDDLLDREKTDTSVTRGEIAQLYTFSEWFWGGFIAIGVAFLTILFGRSKPAQPVKEDNV